MSDTSKTQPNPSSADLMAKLGIDESQVEVKETTTKEVEINSNADQLKQDMKISTKDVNAKNGKDVSFVALKRDGKLKDKNGKVVKDENGQDKPRYVKTRLNGYWTIDKTKDGFYRMTRAIHYTESFLVADYQENK